MHEPLPLYQPADRGGILPIAYFHALAHLGLEGLVIIEPADWFVSVGQFDNVSRIIDLDWCRAHHIPVMRRESGGGPVLLGPGQVFYNLVIKRGTRHIPAVIAEAYRFLSQAPIAAYRRLGLDVQFMPGNDLITGDQRKISGQGAADINDRFCYIGNILREFDTTLMARAFAIEDDALRSRIRDTMDQQLTWLTRALDPAPSVSEIASALIAGFTELLGDVQEQMLPDEVIVRAHRMADEMMSEEALALEQTRAHTAIKIREGVFVSLR